jgi:tetratricopeptide (TPR) repeat protein
LEEVKALQFALDRNPHDHKARYYLGNFFYAHQRFEEGVHAWQESIQGLSKFDVLYRNLGLAAWQRDQDLPLAIELFEKALALNPQNQDLYLHLDDLYKAEGSMEERQQLLDRINALSEVREDVRKRRILILIDLGRYEEALVIMQSETFVPLEMDQSFHNLYVKALMQRAEAHSAAGQVEKAISDYREALEFPENLGVGQPLTLSQAQIYYHLGLAYEKQGRFREALVAWRSAACEHHPSGTEYYNYVQMSLDKLSRYSELGLEA